ncbi:Ig-like domain-containing protein, partial [Vibrio metoecus]
VALSIGILPSVSRPQGTSLQLHATLHLSDGSSSDITGAVNWSVKDANIVQVTEEGVLYAATVGRTTLTANKDGMVSNTMQVQVIEADLLTIEINPSSVSVSRGRTQQLVATAKYSDGNEIDVSNWVAWEIDNPTVALVSSSGLLFGLTNGNTELTATLDGMVSNMVNVNVCDLADACLDIFDTGSGKLFTNSPSVAYLDSIGGSATDDVHFEEGDYGPVGVFYKFHWDSANTLCATYNTKSLGGRTNWRIATFDDLKMELFTAHGNMFTRRGWPTDMYYKASMPFGYQHGYVNLYDGATQYNYPDLRSYTSCVSEP